MLLVVALAAIVPTMSACGDAKCSRDVVGWCEGDLVPAPITIEPFGATLTVGQSASFKVNGGWDIRASVVGCLGAEAVCNPTRLNGGNLPFSKLFDLEWTGRTLVVTFLDASLHPNNVTLDVWGDNKYESQDRRTTEVSVPLQLNY